MIEDNGAGLSNPHNAFVPFYTTKASGSGIGLVLSRQIAEAHGGSIELSNRSDERGCVVKVVLPRMLPVSRGFSENDSTNGASVRQPVESGRSV
jgi:nitrogen fixation/metabolism regulation signal transduction histidine kinase